MAGELILIVEDNVKNLTLVRDLLQFKGYRTVEATSGEEGVQLAVTHRPSLILMDIQLPGIDGTQALHRLRADATTAVIPVVALTAFAMRADRERLLRAGFDAYIEKPINVRELPDQIHQILLARGDQGIA